MLSWCTCLYLCAFKANKLQVVVFFFLRIVILTVSIGVFSKGRVTPPGVRVGLKETERFPDTGVAVGTTSLCTGGSVASIWIKKAGKLQINQIHNQTAATRIKGGRSDVKTCPQFVSMESGACPQPQSPADMICSCGVTQRAATKNFRSLQPHAYDHTTAALPPVSYWFNIARFSLIFYHNNYRSTILAHSLQHDKRYTNHHHWYICWSSSLKWSTNCIQH